MESPFAVEIFPVAFEALEAGAFVEFAGLIILEVFCDKLDFSGLVAFPALGAAEDGEEAPVDLVDGFLDPGFQVGLPGVGVGGADEVVHEPEEVGAVAGTHQLFRSVRLGPAEVEWLAASAVGFPALAGAQGQAPFPLKFFPGLFRQIFRWLAHETECGGRAEVC